jgi:cardiolipin synthase
VISIIATGELFVGYGVRSIGAVITEIINEAKEEIQIMAYLITSMDFIDLLVSAAERGVSVNVIVNNLQEQPENIKKSLQHATENFLYFTVKEFCKKQRGSLHAKVIVVDRQKAVIGSANFTKQGIEAGNHEIAVLLQGNKAEKVAELIDCTVKSL